MTDTLQTLFLYAPVSGKTIEISRVPDEVFATKLVGDGIAVLPENNVLTAPADGIIDNIHPSRHALTMTTSRGVRVLMHIGLDTVHLKGKGFASHVENGWRVTKGQPLITFDLDYIRKTAKSPMTVIVVTNPEKLVSLKALYDRDVVATRDVVMELILNKEDAETAADGVSNGQSALSWEIDIVNPSGMHARPAARLAQMAKKYAADVFLMKGDRKAVLKSPVSVMELDLAFNDKVRVKAVGPDAVAAVTEIVPFLQSGAGDALEKPKTPCLCDETSDTRAEKPVSDGVYTGVPAADGLVAGTTAVLKMPKINVPETDEPPEREKEKLRAAIARVRTDFARLYDETVEKSGRERAEIFKAEESLLDDPVMTGEMLALIETGKSAAFAVSRVFEKRSAAFSSLSNTLLTERANDLRDIERRLYDALGVIVREERIFPERTILLGYEISPADAASLEHGNIVGFASVKGGATSHAAILARALGIPFVTGLDKRVLSVPDGTKALLDGTRGTLRVDPDEKSVGEAQLYEEKQRILRRNERADAFLPSVTKDGVSVSVAGNVGGEDEIDELIANGGAGVGLLRSEFLFANRQTPPNEEEQAVVYGRIAAKLGKDRFLIVRTLDAGGDKPLPYLPFAQEDNPFLGLRGLRFSLEKQAFFRTQLRAVLRACDKTKVKIMFPMVSTVGEFETARKILTEESVLLNFAPDEVGMMVEVPSAAVMADVFAKKSDFFSVGTNDLSQYVMAADRGNASVAALADACQPAVLRLIGKIAEKAAEAHRWAGVCGNLAGEPAAVPLLVGLGVRELSVAVPLIPKIKSVVRLLHTTDCRRLAQDVLALPTALAVHEKLQAFYQHLTEKE